MSEILVRDRSGEMRPDVPETPTHHWRCDGTGRTTATDPDDRLPVACPVCRPHLAVRPHRGSRRPAVTLVGA